MLIFGQKYFQFCTPCLKPVLPYWKSRCRILFFNKYWTYIIFVFDTYILGLQYNIGTYAFVSLQTYQYSLSLPENATSKSYTCNQIESCYRAKLSFSTLAKVDKANDSYSVVIFFTIGFGKKTTLVCKNLIIQFL